MKKGICHGVILACLALILVPRAFAGEGATIIFESGQVIQIDDGYKEIVNGLKSLSSGSQQHKILEITLGGSTFLINVAEVVIVCRDRCSNLTVLHQLDPKRGGNRTEVNLN